jgi:hypothetical protein
MTAAAALCVVASLTVGSDAGAQEVAERIKAQEHGQQAEGGDQDAPGWHSSFVGTFTFAQTSFSNWAEGGTNSAAWQATGNGVFKRVGGETVWTTNVKLEYGEIDAEDTGTRKALDLIFLESILDLQTARYVKPYAAVSAKTQFARGYDYKSDPVTAVSDFADPLLLTQSAGVGFMLKPWLRSRVGFAMQETFTDEFRAYSDDPDTPDELEDFKAEGGLESVTAADKWFGEKLNFKSRLALFWAFNNSDQVDVDWMNDATLKAWGALGVTFKLNLLYNKDVLDKVQFKQVFGVGLSYTFI